MGNLHLYDREKKTTRRLTFDQDNNWFPKMCIRDSYLLGDAEKDAERLEAFLLALHHMDDVSSISRDSKNRDEARERLQNYTFSTQTAESLDVYKRQEHELRDAGDDGGGRLVFRLQYVPYWKCDG